MECLKKDRDAMLAFYDFPAEHWTSIRTTNPIESAFATVRLRTAKMRNCGSRNTTLAMVFKLLETAQRRWNRLHGFTLLTLVVNNEVPRWHTSGGSISKRRCLALYTRFDH